MPLSRRLLVTGLVTCLAVLSPTTPAHAAGDADAAARAAAWVAGHTDQLTTVGLQVDALLALAAVDDPDHVDEARALLEQVRSGAPDYVTASGPDAAAKVALAAQAYGFDARTFVPCLDLVSTVSSGVAADGTFGAWPGPFATGLGAVALARAGEPVPASMVSHLQTYAHPDGGYGFEPASAQTAADADSTAMALLALLAADTPDARPSAEAAVAWARSAQAADGSWAGFVPVNSTAVMGSALISAGEDPAAAVAFLVAQQDASGAFLNAGAPDVMATTQAALLLGGVSYLDVGWDLPGDETPAPCATASPTAASPTAPADGATAAAGSAQAGAAGSATLWLGVAAVVLLAGGGALVLARRRSS